MLPKSFVFTILLLPKILFAQNLILHCGKLIDGRANSVRSEMTIVVADNRIARVEKGFLAPDCGVAAHGDNAKEFQLMVEAGMPPMAAIQSATRVTAELLEIADELGTIEAGKKADIIAVTGNPISDIKVLQKVDFVMKDGKIYKE